MSWLPPATAVVRTVSLTIILDFLRLLDGDRHRVSSAVAVGVDEDVVVAGGGRVPVQVVVLSARTSVVLKS